VAREDGGLCPVVNVLVVSDGAASALAAARASLPLLRPPPRVRLLAIDTPDPLLPAQPALDLGDLGTAAPGTGADPHLLAAQDAATQSVNGALQRAADELARDAGVDVEHSVVSGQAGVEICALAEAEGFDLIVVAAPAGGVLKRLLGGSSADYVIRHATCPVLVIPLQSRGVAERREPSS
jgi:nucleotide-binding universal stress UspA family protein